MPTIQHRKTRFYQTVNYLTNPALRKIRRSILERIRKGAFMLIYAGVGGAGRLQVNYLLAQAKGVVNLVV
jgi:hypothetical protein